MKRLSQVTYKPASKPAVTESIWIQNFPENCVDDYILLELFLDKVTGKPVTTVNKDGIKQYQVSLANSAYAYISITAMSALKKLALAKKIHDKVWVKLVLTPMVPTLQDFDEAPVYK